MAAIHPFVDAKGLSKGCALAPGCDGCHISAEICVGEAVEVAARDLGGFGLATERDQELRAEAQGAFLERSTRVARSRGVECREGSSVIVKIVVTEVRGGIDGLAAIRSGDVLERGRRGGKMAEPSVSIAGSGCTRAR